MSDAIPFVKAHGLGNDFVLVEAPAMEGVDVPAFARAVCDRRFGVGADGVITRERESQVWRMRLVNADGSGANMCGNGLRCFAAWLFRDRLVGLEPFIVRTGKRDVVVTAHSEESATVLMGEPELEGERVVGDVQGWVAGFGDPHFVVPVSRLRGMDIDSVAGSVQGDFEEGANVMFVERVSGDLFGIRSWERGVGETLACGSGACAAYAALGCSGRVRFAFSLGELEVEGTRDGIHMTGPARLAFDGVWLGARSDYNGISNRDIDTHLREGR